jgi:GTPase SAR1 family protein
MSNEEFKEDTKLIIVDLSNELQIKGSMWSWEVKNINNSNSNMSEEKEKVNYSQWLRRGANVFIPTDNSKTQPTLEPGVYNIRTADGIGPYLFKKNLTLDELVDLPMEEGIKVLEGIDKFWKRKEKFAEYGFTYKRGVLMYGSPGNGKSCLINQLCDQLVNELKGIVIYLSSGSELGLYYHFSSEILRIIEPDRKLIVVLEDVDGMVAYKDNETTLLNILDGVNQLDNVVYIATTNYPENLSARILNRPSRFDLRVEVKAPNAECRRIYFEAKLKEHDLKEIDLQKWVDATEEMSMAHLGELIKSVIIIGNDFDETIKTLKEMKVLPNSVDFDKDTKKSVGFINLAR